MSVNFSDDEDIKIAPQDISAQLKKAEGNTDDNIDMFLTQRSNGNTRRAGELGALLVKDLIDCAWTRSPEDVNSEKFEVQLKLLFSYVVHRVIADYAPNTIIANTAMCSFYDCLEEADKRVFEQINDSAAFSLYTYLHRSGEENAESVGDTFARLCEAGDCSDCSNIGQSAYARFMGACTQRILNARFV